MVQPAGRLIRSARGTGIIALFDHRFLYTPYRDYLPADWLPEGGLGELVGEPAGASAEFFWVIAIRR